MDSPEKLILYIVVAVLWLVIAVMASHEIAQQRRLDRLERQWDDLCGKKDTE